MTLADGGKSGEKEQRWEDDDVDVTASGSVGEDLVVELKLSPDECQAELQFILFRGDVPMPSDRYQIQTRGNVVQLTLKQSQKEDAGHYALVAKKLSSGLSISSDERLESRHKIRLSIQDPSSIIEEGEPPIFVRRLSDLAVKVGTRTRFLVEIRSSTSPKVTWHKNDEPVQIGSRFSFVHEGNFYCVDVAPVMVDDQGHWTCMAENGGGRSSCTSFLNVIVPKAYKKPEFVEELRALLTETGTVSLECKVVGVPTPVLKWFKDQKEIKAGDVFALTANPDDPTSLGTYTCEAVNCMGTACSSSRVHVVGKGSREGSLKPADTLTTSGPLPVFEKILRDESCRIGETLVLTCQIHVPPWPKTITWYNKEGRVEPSEKYHVKADGLGGYSIEIKNVEAMDEGEWKCVATSAENMKQFSTCYVAMSIPKNYRMPRFMESLKAVLTEEGLVSFECKVVGFPTPLLRWFKDGQELHPGDVYQLTGTNSLGSYCCIARNCMGEAKSIAELTVEDIQNQLNEEERMQLMSSNQAPKFVKGLRSCEARINEDFTFTIQVSVSPEPNLSWYRDDVPIIESEKYRLARESLGTCNLEVKKLEFMDQAEWKCVAANDFGHSVTSCFLKLIIPKHFKKPKFLESLRAILSEEGAVNLECKVIGVPQPILKWYKDGVELKPGDIHRIISGQDGTCCLGTYTCEATNCMGSVNSSASLLGFEDRVSVRKEEAKEPLTPLHELARNLSLSTIHEERTSQLYDTPQTDHSITMDDRGEVSFSFDGKEVSVSLYETPDLTEEEALQIVEMYADQLSEHITEGNIIELPPMRFTKETSTTGNLLMEAVVIDVSPDYFIPDEEGDDLRTEADVEDVSIMDDQMQSLRSSSYVSSPTAETPGDRVPSGTPPSRPPRRKESRESFSSRSERSEKSLPKGFDWSESYHSAKEPSIQAQSSLQGQDDSGEAFTDALSSSGAGRSKAEESKDIYASFVEQSIEKVSLEERKEIYKDNLNIEGTIATQIGEALIEQVPVKRKKKKKDKQQTAKSSRTPSLSSKASSEESYSLEIEDKGKRRSSKNGREKNERRGSASSNKSGKGRRSRSGSESGKFESAASVDLRRRESDATIMVDDVRIELDEEINDEKSVNKIETVYTKENEGIEERPASATSATSTIDSEKSMTRTNKERILDNVYKLSEPTIMLRNALVDLDSLLPLLQTQGNAADVEKSQMEIAEKIVAPVENLCEQVSAIETKALKSAGDRSLAQNVRISLLEAIGGPTEELLRGIELIRRHSGQQDPKSNLIVLESLTDPVDEILVGLTKIEHELTSRESAESSLVQLEKPIAMERMCRAVSRLGKNVGSITERKIAFGDESTSCSIIERLQSVYQSLEAFLSTVPLSEISGAMENNVDTLVVETLVRPLEELSRNLNIFGTTNVQTPNEQDSIVANLAKSMSEMRTRLEALTLALETYEKESGEQGITELHADLVKFLRYTMDDAVERLEKLKLKKKRVTQDQKNETVTPTIFRGKSKPDGDEDQFAIESNVESSESEETNVLQELAEETAAIMKKVTVPSIAEAEIKEAETKETEIKTLEKSGPSKIDEKTFMEVEDVPGASREKTEIKTLEKSGASKIDEKTSIEVEDVPGASREKTEIKTLEKSGASKIDEKTFIEVEDVPGASREKTEIKTLEKSGASKIDEKTFMEVEDVPGASREKKEKLTEEKSVEEMVEGSSTAKRKAHPAPELDPDLSLPEMLLDPLIDVQANLSDVISDFESQESAEESSLPGGSELAACLTELRESVATAVHTATTLKSASTVDALIDLREPLLDLQLAMASAVSPEEVKLIREATIPLAELKVIVAAVIKSPQTSEVSQIQMKSVLRMLEDIEAEVTKAVDDGAILKASEASPVNLKTEEVKSISIRPPEEVERAAVALTGVHFALSNALERVEPLESSEASSLQGGNSLKKMAEQAGASNLIVSIEKLRQCVGNLAVAIGTPVSSTENNDQYSYDILFDELARLEEPLLNLQKVLLTEEHGPEDRHVLNDVASPIRSLKEVVQDVTKEIGGGSTPIVLELIEDVEKDVTLIAMEALKKALAAKSELSGDDERSSVSSSSKPGEVPGIISKWLDPVEDWLTSTTEEGTETGEFRGKSAIAPAIDDLKRELLKIAIQTSYSEPPSDVALIEALTELQEPLARVCQVLNECHEPENLDIVEGLIQPTKHLLGTILDASLTHEAGKVLRPVLEAIEELENQIPLTIKRATYERELQRVVRSMTPEEPETLMAEEIPGIYGENSRQAGVLEKSELRESLMEESRKIATGASEFEVGMEENVEVLSQEDFTSIRENVEGIEMMKSVEERAGISKVNVEEENSMEGGEESLMFTKSTKEQAKAREIAEQTKLQKAAEEEKLQQAVKSGEGRAEQTKVSVQEEKSLENAETQAKMETVSTESEKGSAETQIIPKVEKMKDLAESEAKMEDVGTKSEKSGVETQITTKEEQTKDLIESEAKMEGVSTKSAKENENVMADQEKSLKSRESKDETKIEIDEEKSLKPSEPEHLLTTETVEVITVDNRPFSETITSLESPQTTEIQSTDTYRADQLDLWTLTLLGPLDRLGNAVLSLDRSIDELAHGLLCRPLDSLHKQIEIAESQFNRPVGQSLENDVETIIEGFLSPVNQLHSALSAAVVVWNEEQPRPVVRELLRSIADSSTELCELLDTLRKKLVVKKADQSLQEQQEDASLVETINAVLAPLDNLRNLIEAALKSLQFVDSMEKSVEKISESETIEEGRSFDGKLIEGKAVSEEEMGLARASGSMEQSLEVVKSEETLITEELESAFGRDESVGGIEKAREIVEESVLEKATTSKPEVAKGLGRGSKGKEDSLDIEETTAKPLEELIEAIVDSSGPRHVSSSPEDYQSITPDVSEENGGQSETLMAEEIIAEKSDMESVAEIVIEELNKDKAKILAEENLARAELLEGVKMSENREILAGNVSSLPVESLQVIEIQERKEDKAKVLSEEKLSRVEIATGPEVGESAQQVVTEILEKSKVGEIAEISEAEEKLQTLKQAEMKQDNIQEESLGQRKNDDLKEENAKLLSEEGLVQAEIKKQKSLMLESSGVSQENILEEDVEEILPKTLTKEKAELRDGESLATAGITDAPEMKIKARDAEVSELEPEVAVESLEEISAEKLKKEKAELRDGESLATAGITDAPEMKIKARDAEVSELEPEVVEESLQEISAEKLKKEKAELREGESLATAGVTDAPEMKIKARDAEVSELEPEVVEESLQEISAEKLKKEKAELREGESLATAGITDAPEMKIKERHAEISELKPEVAEESLQEISAEKLKKEKAELREGENLAIAGITEAPEMKIKARDAEVSELKPEVAEESLEEISAEKLKTEKAQLREGESLATAGITDAPEMKIKARDAEVSELEPEVAAESLEEISAEKLKKEKAELGDGESLATAGITDAPEMKIKARDAKGSELEPEVAEESLEEISAEKLKKEKAELREGESLATAGITDAPEMKIKERDAEISELKPEVAEESLQEISAEKLKKEKAELREGESLTTAGITDAPEMKIKARNAEVSELEPEVAEESLQEISAEKLKKEKAELREGESLAIAGITEAPEMKIKARDAKDSELEPEFAEESLQEISAEKLKKENAELREDSSLDKASITDAPEMKKAGKIEVPKTAEMAKESFEEIPKEEAQKQKASISIEQQRHMAEIVKIEAAKMSEENVIEAAQSAIVEIVETPAQKIFKMKKERMSKDETEEIIQKVVIKPVEEVVAMEDQRIVEIVETPTEKVIKMKIAVQGKNGIVEEVVEEIIVKKPVEGWAKSLVEEEERALSVSPAKIQEFAAANISPEVVQAMNDSKQIMDEDAKKMDQKDFEKKMKEKEQLGTKESEMNKTEEEKLAMSKREEAERSQREEAEKLEKETVKRVEEEKREAERLEDEESQRIKKEEEEKQRKIEAEKVERDENERQEKAKKEEERLKLEETERLKRIEAERLETEEAERLKRDKEEQLRKEEAERLEKEELERQDQAKAEAERLRLEELERVKKEEQERLRREEAEKLAIEERERLEKEKQEAERLQREEEERLRKERAERLEREEHEREEKAREEAERMKKEEADRLEREELERKEREAERLKKEEAERLEKEEFERKKQEAERLKQEELARAKKEEEERLEREKVEKIKQDELERKKQEAEQLKQEKIERVKKEEEERLKKEEAATLEKEKLEKEKEEAERLKKEEAERLEKEKLEKEKEEAERLKKEEAARLEKEKLEKQKEEAERLKKEEAARLEKEKLEKEKEEAERLKKEEAAKLEKEKLEKEKEEAERLKKEEAERLEKEKLEKEKEEAERLKKEEAARLEKEKLEKQKEEAERLKKEEAARLEKEKLEKEKEEAERLKKEEAAKLEKEKLEKEKEEAERLKKEEAERLEKEKLEKEKEEAERLKKEEAERLEKEKLEKEKEEAERLKKEEAARLEKEKLEKEKEEAERLKKEEAARLEKEKLEKEKEEAERLKKEEAARLEKEKLEKEKEEAERLKKEEAAKLEKEKLEKEKEEAERLKKEEAAKLEKEKLEKEKEEAERLKKEEAAKLEKEKLEKEKEEAERLKKEEAAKLEKEKLEKEKEEAERLKKEEAAKLEKEKLEKEKEEAEHLKKEEAAKLEKEKLEKEKEEAERLKKEEAAKLEKEKLEKEKEEAERLKKEEAAKLEKEKLEKEKEEAERLKKEEAAKLEKEKEEAERLKKKERKRAEKKEAERMKKDEEERLKNEEEDCLKSEEAQKLEQEKEAERLKNVELERQQKEEAKRLKKEDSKEESPRSSKKGGSQRSSKKEGAQRRSKKEKSKAESNQLKKQDSKEEIKLLQKEDSNEEAKESKQNDSKEEAKRLKKGDSKEESPRSSKKGQSRRSSKKDESSQIKTTDSRVEKKSLKKDDSKEEDERLKKDESPRGSKKDESPRDSKKAESQKSSKKDESKEESNQLTKQTSKDETKLLQKEESKRLKKENSQDESKQSSKKLEKEIILSKEAEEARTSYKDEEDDEKTPTNADQDIKEKSNQRHVRLHEEPSSDHEPRSSSTIRTDSEMDSEHSESSRDPSGATKIRKKRSNQQPEIEIDREISKERPEHRETSRPALSKIRDDTLSSDDKYYTPHYSATSRIHEFTPGPRDRGKKPSFCTKLTDRTAAEASRIKLTCTVLGDPEPQVYWTKDGKELPSSSNRHCTIEENGMVSLELYSALPKDSGEYSCVARNVHGQAYTEAKLKVYAGYEPSPALPTFTRSIKDTYRSGENELVLECRVRGQPSPKITWLKDGQILQISDRYQQCDFGDGICRLKISHPDFYDSGLYTCRAENDSKISDCTSHVVNFDAKGIEHGTGWRGSYRNLTSSDRDTGRPRFSSYLTDHSVPAGGTIALQVEVKGVPTPDITWMRGDRREPISAYKARTFADSGVYTLIVPEATESETGTYVCRASNAYGYVDTSANVEVISSSSSEGGKPAMFISRPAETMIHVTVGEDVSVSFRFNGVPKPRIVWMKGLRDITNGPRSYKESHDDYVRLTLKRALVSDEGTYCILVKNRYGCDRTFYTVKVKQRARSLTPSPDWGTLDTDHLLANIHDTQRSYLKQVPGPITSEPIVVDGGRNWLALSWGKAVQHGPAPVVAYRVDAWLLGGEGGARWVELGITPVNTFDAFNLRPGGEYKFRITPRNRYGWGEPVTMTNSVTVREIVKFPEFSKILPGQLKALRGEILHLECEVRSESKAEVKWYRDTTDVDGIRDPRYMTYYNGSKCTLTVQSIKENDSGRYVCEATNTAGRVSTFARVQVVTDPKIVEADEKLRRMRTLEPSNEERPPEFTMRLRDRRVQMTYPVRLTCQVSGHPEPEVTWYKNREEIFQDDNVSFWDDESHFHTLEISHSTIEDSGVYMAKARNVNGSVSCRCHLVVDKGIRAYVAPEFFRHLDAVYTVKSGGELRMTAQIEAYPTVGIVWHRDGHRLRPSRSAVMTLNHDGSVELSLGYVTLRDAGLYCCTATNEVGQTESTTRVTVIGTADEELPSLSQSLPDVVESVDVPYSKEPLFVTKPLSTEAVEGDTVIILCEVVGDPKPEVIWLRDFLRPDYYRDAAHFRRVGAGPQYRLEIPYAKLDFTGAYSVIAKNCHGEAKAIISLQIYARGQGKAESSMEQNTIKHGKVQTLPSIKRPLRDLRCCDGDAVTLICKVHATPEPDVRWEKSGKLVPLGEDFAADFDGETARLSIQHVYSEDEGEYTCVAYNDLGKAFTSACLIVDVPEGKESALSRRLIRPIGLLSAESTPISTPRSTPIRSLSPSGVSSRRELKPATRTPRGQSTGRRPRLPTGPKFYAVPHNRVAEEGETVRFQCAVAGHPTPWVTWDKDGIPVTPTARISLKEKDDVRILEITEINHEDAGLYRITLENDVGRTEATARLEIIKGRQSSVTRNIRTRSASPRTYSIYSRSPITSAIRGDTHLRPRTNDSMSGRGGTLSPTLPRWHHRNGKPPIESPEPARRMNKQTMTSTRTTIKNGPVKKSSNLKAPIPPTKPRSSSLPRQNQSSKEIPVNPARKTKTSPAQRVKNEENIRSNKNSRTTITTMTNGSMIPKRLPISRSRSPKIIEKMTIQSPQEKKDFVDSGETKMLKISEMLNEKVEIMENEEKINSATLRNCDEEILKMEASPIVELSSVSRNEIFEENLRFIMEDTKEPRPPVILAAPADVIALRGAKIILLATFDGEPQPRVRWLRKGRDVRLDDKAEIETSRGLTCLTLDGATTEQAGKYAVTLENIAGRDCRYVNVTVEGVPDPPAGTPCVQSITRSGKAIVTWRSPSYDGGCAVTGYSVEMKRIDEPCWIAIAEARHSLSHTVTGLVPEDTYSFRVRAENAHGVSEPSTISDLVTVPGENDEEIGGQVFTAEINQIEIEEEEEEFEPAFEARIVNPEDRHHFEERYEVLEELGKGRYGIVRRILEKSTGLNLAAKFVRTIKAKDRQQVHEEIGIMNRLRHPKLLRLAAAFESPKEMIMVTEYISGGELFERVVADDFTLTEKDSIQFVKQICEGVEYMHVQSVVHLDLKPENIMCHTRTSHRIKLIDFGLAQTLKPDTPVRVLFGTPEFIPPEIIGFEPIGTESDMWSVGVICYVLLTGLSPFMGDNDAETFANITRADYDFDDKAFTAISQEAKDFISALLVKRKELRMSAKQCLEHPWLAQRAESMSRVALPTDKLKKFIVRRKWQKTGNAIRALGRMAILSANSRKNLSASSSPTKTDFGDELFSDVTGNIHGFKPIQPVVIIEDKTETHCEEKLSKTIVEEEDSTANEEIEEILSPHKIPAEIQTKTIPVLEEKSEDCSNGLDKNSPTITELENIQDFEYNEINDNAPLIQEIDDFIENDVKSRNLATEMCIEDVSNEFYNENEITMDLNSKITSSSDSNETTRKQSFSSFVNLEITESGTIETGQEVGSDQSRRNEDSEESIEYEERTEEEEEKETMKDKPISIEKILVPLKISEDRKEGQEVPSKAPIVTKAWCKTNNSMLVDEEDEIARLTRGRSHHFVRTGSVSRTAKMFEKEDETNSSSMRQQQNPINRTTPIVPEARPQNERIRKAFAFWNK